MPRRLALVVVLASLSVGGCASSAPPAAVVGGQRIERAALRRELSVLRGTPDLAAQVAGTSRSTIPAEIGAGWLSTLVYHEVLRGEFRRRGLSLDAASVERAEASLAEQLGPLSDSLPAWFRRRVAERNALATAVREALVGMSDDASLESYFEAHRNELAETCVAHILVPSEEEASELAQAIRSGADFEEIARSRSTDRGSAESGGALGCVRPGNFVSTFAEAVMRAPLGEIQDPVETQFGWHVIRVTERRTPELAEVRQEVEEARGQEAEEAVGRFLEARLAELSVTVDPRYGRFERPDGEPLPRVVPREEPDPPDSRPSSEGEAPAPLR